MKITEDIEVIPVGRTWVTKIDGVEYSKKELSKYLGLKPNTVNATYHRLKNVEDMVLWVRKKLWLADQGLSAMLIVYYSDGFFITSQQIASICGLTVRASVAIGKEFEAGEITKAELLSTKKPKGQTKAAPNWGNLGNTVRDHNLKKIPSPTENDYKLAG